MIILIILGCGEFNDSTNSLVIKKPGSYNLKPSDYKVLVEVKDALVIISIVDGNGKVVDVSDEAGDSQTWALFWDEGGQLLWLFSSDIGEIVWNLSGEAAVRQPVTIESRELIQLIPHEFRCKVPSYLRRYWGKNNCENFRGD